MNDDDQAYRRVKLPDGRVIKFPSSMSNDEISAQIRQNFPEFNPQSFGQKALRYAGKAPASGLGKLTRNIADTPPAIGNFISKKLGSDFRMPYTGITDEEIYSAVGAPPEDQQNWGDKLGQLAPDVLGAFLVPEIQLPRLAAFLSKAPAIAGKILPKMFNQSATQGLFGGAAAPVGQKQKGAAVSAGITAPFAAGAKAAQVTSSVPLRHALGLTGGTGAGYLGYELGKGIGLPSTAAGGLGALLGAASYRGLSSPNAKKAAQIEGVDLTDPRVIERLEASDRLGVNITPAEATESPFLGGEHAKLGRSKEGSKAYYDAAKERIAQEESSIGKLLETIYEPGSMDARVSEGYQRLYPRPVSPVMGLKYSGNKTLDKVTKNIEKDPELMEWAREQGIAIGEGDKLRLDKSKLGYWDLVKRYLDREVTRVSSPEAPSVDKLKKDTFDKLRKGILKDLDSSFTEYSEVRSLAERDQARRTIEKAFDKTEVGGKQFYKAFESDKKFDDLMHHLREVPEAQSMMRDMRLIFEESRKKPTITTSAGQEVSGMKQDRNFKNAMETFLEKIAGSGKYNPEAINFIYSGKWQERMKEINKISDTQKKIGKFIELLGDASAPISRKALEDD